MQTNRTAIIVSNCARFFADCGWRGEYLRNRSRSQCRLSPERKSGHDESEPGRSPFIDYERFRRVHGAGAYPRSRLPNHRTPPGLTTYDLKDVDLRVGQNLDLNLKLAVSQGATQVVTGEAPLIEDTNTDVSQVVGERDITQLPINGRRVDQFVLLTPGVSNDATFLHLSDSDLVRGRL